VFTGIIEEIGIVQAVRKSAVSLALTVHAHKILSDMREGDSIAVNGVCLTVTSFSTESFTADVMHETLLYTALGRLHSGSQVNLERAMSANGRFGGHIVAGHIDGTGTILAVRKDDNAVWYTIRAGEDILHYIVKKGSITVDGVSLTVAETAENRFQVSIIPHTAACTTLGLRRVGDTVNLETDCMGKYIEKLLYTPAPQNGATQAYLEKFGF
jgi:riboflavin synthase